MNKLKAEIGRSPAPTGTALLSRVSRLRPIYANLSMLTSATPKTGSAGATSRDSIGTGVIGGMLGATFITVLFIPLFYVLLTSRKEPSTANEPEHGPVHAEPMKGSGS